MGSATCDRPLTAPPCRLLLSAETPFQKAFLVNISADSARLAVNLRTAALALLVCSVLFAAPCRAAADEPAPQAPASESTVTVRSGGTGRFLFGRWGAVTAGIINRNNTPATNLVVVTPSTGGLQYGRRIEIPARTIFDATWPIQVTGTKSPGPVDFRYLHFPNGEDDGVIRTRSSESELPSFSAIAFESPAGLAGYIPDMRDVERRDITLMNMGQAYRFPKVGSAGLASFLARDVSHHSDCLDPLDTLLIGDPLLPNYPMACDSIRNWLQRGGRLLLPIDIVGEQVIRTLLADSLPLTVVGETSADSVTLDINPDYPTAQYPARSIVREYDEPVRYVRLIAGAGEVIWSIDGWPVAIRLPVGRGAVLLTAVDPKVFIVPRDNSQGGPDWAPIESSRRMLETLFDGRPDPLITQPAALEHAASLVGYRIPGRTTAALLLCIFPVLLLVVGLQLIKRSAGEKLVWAVPALAVLAAIPALTIGLKSRSVAPNTLIETRIMSAAAGSATVVSDGFASVYLPTAMDLPVSSDSGSFLDAKAEAANLDYRRLIWDGASTSHWEHLNQPAGLKTYPLRAVREGAQPFNVSATFDESGFRAELQAPGFDNAEDFLAVGRNAERLSLVRTGNTLTANPDNLLETGQFRASTMTSDEQRHAICSWSPFSNPPNVWKCFPAKAPCCSGKHPAKRSSNSIPPTSGPLKAHLSCSPSAGFRPPPASQLPSSHR